MKVLLILILSLNSGPGRGFNVIGHLKGSIIIYCRWPSTRWQLEKHFCKVMPDECVHVDKIQNTGTPKDPSSRDSLLTVIYRNLSVEDAGLYRCGGAGGRMHDVNLNVNTDPCCLGPKTVIGSLGETVTINCSYPEEFVGNIKVFFRLDGEEFIDVIQTIEPQIGRFSISEDRSSRMFSLRISDVREEDGGVYFCGVWNKEKWVSYFSLQTEIQLQVPAPGSSFIIIIILISVCVCVSLLLIGGSTLVYVLRRRETEVCAGRRSETKHRANGDGQSISTGHENNVSMGSFCQSLNLLNQSDSTYQTLDPNTNQSDSTYQTLNPNMNQSDSTYQTLNPKTKQSDSNYQNHNPNTNQSDSTYQTLNPSTNQSDSTYQSLNPKTKQSDSTYYTLNPNTNQSDSNYQTLNPNMNQSDSAYQNQNPINQSDPNYQNQNHINQSDSTYQSLDSISQKTRSLSKAQL